MPRGDYPLTLLRGIPNRTPQFFDSKGEVTGTIFRPDDRQTAVGGMYEISINWEDNASVEALTLATKKEDGSLHYRGGVARVSRGSIDLMKQEPAWLNSVDYRRDEIDGNEHHGLLLLGEDRVKGDFRAAFYRRLKFAIMEVIPPIEEKAG